jgi:predicted permease
MSMFRLIARRLRALFFRRALDDELDEEVQFHLDRAMAQNLARGMGEQEARQAARRSFGGAEQVKEEVRDGRGVRLAEESWSDLRHAARVLGKSPGFTAVAVITLALGIGASAAIFSVVDGVLLRPLPYPHPDRLVVIQESLPPQLPEFPVSPHHYFEWTKQVTSFERLAAMHQGSYNLTGAGEPIRVSAARVTSSAFSTFGAVPVLGRDFSPAEDLPGNDDVVVLSHGFWCRQFGGRADILERTIGLDGRPFRVVGVMPRGFQLDAPVDIFTPAAYAPSDVHDIAAIGRLKPGVTLQQARTEMALVAGALARDDPDSHTGWGVKLTGMHEFKVRDVRPVLWALLGAVGFLLIIACANVANLLLARATVRTREISLRTALGASRGRLVRQLLTESLLLALMGGLLGGLVARLGVGALLALAPDDLPRAQEILVDGRILAFTCALAVVTGVVFGLVPAFQATSGRILTEGGSGASEGRRQQRVRRALVVAQVSIALVLLVGAGLLIRSFARLRQVNPGFRPQGALAVTVSLPPTRYGQGAQQASFAERAIAQLGAIPGVQAAGACQGFQFSGAFDFFFLRVAGRPSKADGSDSPRTNAFLVTGDYFEAMGIPLLRGRRLDARDGASAPAVSVVNESLARTVFAGEDPIGKRIGAAGSEHWTEIVGVVGDARPDRLDAGAPLQAYAPLAQVHADWGALTFVVRGGGDAAGLPAAIRAAIRAVDRGQAVTSIRPLTELVAASMARQRFTMLLFAIFSVAALLLAAVGIYGVMAYSVSRRTRELGIRMALGAQAGDVLRLVSREGGRLVGLGLAVGLAGALALTRFLASMLFGVSSHDPLTFVAIAGLLSVVAAVACLLPARRATRVDPMTALRAD